MFLVIIYHIDTNAEREPEPPLKSIKELYKVVQLLRISTLPSSLYIPLRSMMRLFIDLRTMECTVTLLLRISLKMFWFALTSGIVNLSDFESQIEGAGATTRGSSAFSLIICLR